MLKKEFEDAIGSYVQAQPELSGKEREDLKHHLELGEGSAVKRADKIGHAIADYVDSRDLSVAEKKELKKKITKYAELLMQGSVQPSMEFTEQNMDEILKCAKGQKSLQQYWACLGLNKSQRKAAEFIASLDDPEGMQLKKKIFGAAKSYNKDVVKALSLGLAAAVAYNIGTSDLLKDITNPIKFLKHVAEGLREVMDTLSGAASERRRLQYLAETIDRQVWRLITWDILSHFLPYFYITIGRR